MNAALGLALMLALSRAGTWDLGFGAAAPAGPGRARPSVRYVSYVANPLRAVYGDGSGTGAPSLYGDVIARIRSGPGGYSAFESDGVVRVYRYDRFVAAIRRPDITCVGWIGRDVILRIGSGTAARTESALWRYDTGRRVLSPVRTSAQITDVVTVGRRAACICQSGGGEVLSLRDARTLREVARPWPLPRGMDSSSPMVVTAGRYVSLELRRRDGAGSALWIVDTAARRTRQVQVRGLSGICAGRSDTEVLASCDGYGRKGAAPAIVSVSVRTGAMATVRMLNGTYNLLGLSTDRRWVVVEHVTHEVGPIPLEAILLASGTTVVLEPQAYTTCILE